jgi:hypothetical protein
MLHSDSAGVDDDHRKVRQLAGREIPSVDGGAVSAAEAEESVRQRTALAPSSRERRNASRNSPGAGAAVVARSRESRRRL